MAVDIILCERVQMTIQNIAYRYRLHQRSLKVTAAVRCYASSPARMRAATYRFAPGHGDNEGAECAVYFFGAGQGGSVQANLDRWIGQFTRTDGKPAPAKIQKRTIHGLAVTTTDVSGEYSGMGGPMASSRTVKPRYRLLGAIIENPGGNVFLKFTGPERTVAANERNFTQLLDSFQKQ
jgi:hypothetical protein